MPIALHSDHYAVPVVADLDGDGAPDFATLRWDARDVIAIGGRQRKQLWRHPTGGPNMGGLAAADLDGDRLPDLVAPSMDGHVYALRGKDGKLLWKTSIGPGGSRSPPALHDLTGDGVPEALVVSRAGALWVLDGRTGRPLLPGARTPESTEGLGKPAVAALPGGRTLILAPLGRAGVVALDWATRQGIWASPAGHPVIASPVIFDLDRDGRLEVVSATVTGEMMVLDLETGRRLWGLKIADKPIEADPAVGDLDGDGIADIVIADHAMQLTAVSGRGTLGGRRAWREAHRR